MDFTLINSFIAVAEEGSFSTAAKHLFLSQQSLSKQIAKLEAELDTERQALSGDGQGDGEAQAGV